MNENLPKLKPCPFCGGKAVFKCCLTGRSGYDIWWSYKVCCSRCGVEFPDREELETKLRIGDDGKIFCVIDDRLKAAGLWNKREG
mgnify:CR=1 FL=1